MIIDAHAVRLGLPNGPLRAKTMARWEHADAVRRQRAAEWARIAPRIPAVPAEGAPPAGMSTYADLLQALNALVTACFGSQRAMCRVHPNLVRPTVSAALRDRNSLSEAMLDSILRACGVQGQDRQAWLESWFRLGLPRQTGARERQVQGYHQRGKAGVAVTGSGKDRPSLEIRISGLIYVRVERCPRWLAHVLCAAAATLAGWMLARHPWMLGK